MADRYDRLLESDLPEGVRAVAEEHCQREKDFRRFLETQLREIGGN